MIKFLIIAPKNKLKKIRLFCWQARSDCMQCFPKGGGPSEFIGRFSQCWEPIFSKVEKQQTWSKISFKIIFGYLRSYHYNVIICSFDKSLLRICALPNIEVMKLELGLANEQHGLLRMRKLRYIQTTRQGTSGNVTKVGCYQQKSSFQIIIRVCEARLAQKNLLERETFQRRVSFENTYRHFDWSDRQDKRRKSKI